MQSEDLKFTLVKLDAYTGKTHEKTKTFIK